LETNEGVIAERRNEPIVVRQGGEHLGWGTGNVKKEPDAIAVAEFAQCPRQRHQMVVMNPDQVVRLENIVQSSGEQIVDPKIAGKIAAGKFGEVDAVVQ